MGGRGRGAIRPIPWEARLQTYTSYRQLNKLGAIPRASPRGIAVVADSVRGKTRSLASLRQARRWQC